MASPELPDSNGNADATFTSGDELRALVPDQIATVTDITDAPSLRNNSAEPELLTPDVTERNRKAASVRWLRGSTRDYGDLRFKDSKDFS